MRTSWSPAPRMPTWPCLSVASASSTAVRRSPVVGRAPRSWPRPSSPCCTRCISRRVASCSRRRRTRPASTSTRGCSPPCCARRSAWRASPSTCSAVPVGAVQCWRSSWSALCPERAPLWATARPTPGRRHHECITSPVPYSLCARCRPGTRARARCSARRATRIWCVECAARSSSSSSDYLVQCSSSVPARMCAVSLWPTSSAARRAPLRRWPCRRAECSSSAVTTRAFMPRRLRGLTMTP
mmetsp:Transcript_72387/g.224803  ORF Transcript_72387/g.224803 Transcript_72387/m.224803 type:complete len:242 (+) Transcript_72387:624-1349(+)